MRQSAQNAQITALCAMIFSNVIHVLLAIKIKNLKLVMKSLNYVNRFVEMGLDLWHSVMMEIITIKMDAVVNVQLNQDGHVKMVRLLVKVFAISLFLIKLFYQPRVLST